MNLRAIPAVATATTLATLTAALLAAGASAADLGTPYRRGGPPPEPIYETAPLGYSPWTGFYFGATLGYAEGETGVSGGSGVFNFDSDGGMGTLFGGYNWQAGNMVLGVEADIGTGYIDGSGIAGVTTLGSEVDMFGSLRGRVGVLMSPALLAYATAGAAWADMDLAMSGVGTRSEMFWGYQVGVGGEYMISPNWSLRLEYLYTDLAEQSVSHGGVTNSFDPDFHTIRAGFAIKF